MEWKNIDKEIIIQERIEYGNVRYYPVNELGKKFAHLLGTKTLSIEALDFIVEELGITVNFKASELVKWNTKIFK
tara:strand:- start:1121 stop:1345 length:225 start_codon:yes stop_codon:yes gene_type:complete